MSEGQKLCKFADTSIKLKNYNIHKVIVRFARINFFHIGMEMLLTVYIIEMAVLLTNFFSKNHETISITPFVIFLPFIVAIPATTACVIGALGHFRSKAIEYIDKYTFNDKEKKKINIQKTTFDNFVKIHRINTRYAHTACVLLYLIISLGTGVAVSFSTQLFNNRFLVFVPAMGVLLGFVWNMDGYYRHQRILWCRFFTGLSDEDREIDVENNCKVYKKSIIWIVISMLVLLGLFAFVLCNFHSKDTTIKNLLDNGYGTLIIPFFSWVILYVRFCYSVSFKDNDSEILCPSLEAVLSEYPFKKD